MLNVQDCGHFFRFRHTQFRRDDYGQLLSRETAFDLTKDEMARTYTAFKQAFEEMNPEPVEAKPVRKTVRRKKTATAE